MNDNVLIITRNRYPNEDAGAVRQHIFAKAFKDLGFSVTIIGMGKSTDFQYKNYDGVEYISLRHKNSSYVQKIANQILYGKRLRNCIKKLEPKIIMIVDLPLTVVSYIKKYACKKCITLIHDSVEWYSKEEFKLGKLDMNYIHKDLLNRYFIDNNFSVVAISEYLKNHFESDGKKVCRIPFVLDVKSIVAEKKLSDEKLIIVYAGTIGKKDYFDTIISALNKLDENQKQKIEFRIIGCNIDGFIKSTGISREKILLLGQTVKFLGRIPRKEVIENLKEANFTILIRPENLRYAAAGFPTKVTESLAYATPVIANITSDLGQYLSDNYNSVIVKDISANSICEAFGRVLKFDKNELEKLCKNARDTAETKLDYRLFSDKLKEIL